MVEDFGFTHICTGELLRAECEKVSSSHLFVINTLKGTKEGERLKKLMCDGAIIPTEQVVPLLKSAMMQHPSKVSNSKLKL
jgi:adenylate kinase family enzyme